MLKKITLFIITYFFIFLSNTFAVSIPVENVFSDISSDYKYYNELQTLYDRGMIFPDSQGKFNKFDLLNRDEFVGISVEVICEQCISPNTSFSFIQNYAGTQSFYDVFETNKYFYCIAEAEDKSYVRGYHEGDSCEDGTQRDGEIPFCPNNKISLEEAVTVILRNSGIYTQSESDSMIANIYSSPESYPDLSEDVKAINLDGGVNSFYPYLKKALEYEYVEYDTSGVEKTYKIIEINDDGKIYPKQSITKEKMLQIAYVAYKSMDCITREEGNLSINMNIYDKSCDSSAENCDLSNLNDDSNIYDFGSEVYGVCDAGVNAPQGYIWRFYNEGSGEQILRYGEYLDNYEFLAPGQWKVFFRVIDNCGNTGEVYSSLFISSIGDGDNGISSIGVDLDAGPLVVVPGEEVTFETLIEGGEGPYVCEYDYADSSTGTGGGEDKLHSYDNTGSYEVDVICTDANGNSSTSSVTIQVVEDGDQIVAEGLSLVINAGPLYGPGPLYTDFIGIVSGGEGPYDYNWDFGDANNGFGENISNIFLEEGLYTVELIVTDVNGLQVEGIVNIFVTQGGVLCEVDSDGDGVSDCDDLCPLNSGEERNLGCPVLSSSCQSDCSCPDNYTCSSSDPDICSVSGICIPIDQNTGANDSCLFEEKTSFKYGNAICNSCPCPNFLDFKSVLRKCDLIFPAITSPDSTSIYSKGDEYEIK